MTTGRMKGRTGRLVAAVAVALLLPLLQGASTPGPDSIVDLAVEAGTVRVSGTSNAHDWSCETTRFDAALQVQRDAGARPAGVAQAAVTVPVETLACGNGTMDGNLRKALKAGDFPTVRFEMTGHELVPDPADPQGFRVLASGTLTIAGTSRPIALTVDGTMEGDRLRLRGSHELLMTDFGVRPPTAMLGVLKTGDRVTVGFDLTTRYGAAVR